MQLMQANKQWASRPADERFENLHALGAMVGYQRQLSNEKVVSSRSLSVIPTGNEGLQLVGPNGNAMDFTHYSFGQFCARVETPAAYMRKLEKAAPIAADCLNYGIKFLRDVHDLGVLLTRYDSEAMPNSGAKAYVRAVTGPSYGRIWNSDIVNTAISEFGDGVTGLFTVPGEFGEKVRITRENTTIYGSDRDIWIFLCDEVNRIALNNSERQVTNNLNGLKRDLNSGLARGFYLRNSEVGDQPFELGMFLFDFACRNRIIWGAQDFRSIKFRHTASAPDKWLHEVAPILREYSKGSVKGVEETIAAAKATKTASDLDEFLTKRYGLTQKASAAIQEIHMREEGRPIETLWDLTTGITAHAKGIEYQNERVAMERIGGRVLDLVKIGSTSQESKSLSDLF